MTSDLIGIDQQRFRVDVGEDGGGPQLADHRGGSEEGERGNDHLVAGADTGHLEGDSEGVGSAGDADGMGDFEGSLAAFLELDHRLPQAKGAVIDHLGDGIEPLLALGFVVGAHCHHRYRFQAVPSRMLQLSSSKLELLSL